MIDATGLFRPIKPTVSADVVGRLDIRVIGYADRPKPALSMPEREATNGAGGVIHPYGAPAKVPHAA